MCSNVFKLVQNLFKTCSNVFKLVQNLFKRVQMCSNLFKTCSNMFKLNSLVKYVGLGQSQSVLLLKGKSSSSVVWFPNPLAHDIQIHVSRGTRLKPWYSSVWCKSLRISWSFWSSGGVFPIISHLSDVYGMWLPYMQDERNLIIKRQLV